MPKASAAAAAAAAPRVQPTRPLTTRQSRLRSGWAVRAAPAGAGGPVTVTNGTGGTILTQGVAAFGIFAQSVGGGGGEGSLAGTVNGSLQSLGVGIGGNGGGGGDGGVVTVTTGDGTSGSTITTTGKHGIAIFAQSVGGGGGLVRTMTTDQTFDPSKIVINPQGRLADIHGFSLNIGGQNGISGAGGNVNVFASGPITTSGLDAHAILAQSIGGGGGMAVGGQVALPQEEAGVPGARAATAGPLRSNCSPAQEYPQVVLALIGILAQSIGGGGGAAGISHRPCRYQLGTDERLVAPAPATEAPCPSPPTVRLSIPPVPMPRRFLRKASGAAAAS